MKKQNNGIVKDLMKLGLSEVEANLFKGVNGGCVTKRDFITDVEACMLDYAEFSINELDGQLSDLVFDAYHTDPVLGVITKVKCLAFLDGVIDYNRFLKWVRDYKIYVGNVAYYDSCLYGEGEGSDEIEAAEWVWENCYRPIDEMCGLEV